jgi:hypothetical protein
MALKYIGRYLQEECMQKNPLKNTLYFGKYKKDKFLIVNNSKVVVKYKIIYLFVRNLSFLYFLKYKVFFNGIFLYMLRLYISFYIFKAIIFQNIDVLDFKIFKNLKVEGSLVLNNTFRGCSHFSYQTDRANCLMKWPKRQGVS